jgi:hypothetical protein
MGGYGGEGRMNDHGSGQAPTKLDVNLSDEPVSALGQRPRGKKPATRAAGDGLELENGLNAEEQRAVGGVLRVIVVGNFGADEEVVVHLVRR